MTHEQDNLLPQDLQFRLRGMRQDAQPSIDLWPAIAERIAAQPRGEGSNRFMAGNRRGAARFAPWALAASLALAVGVAWQLRPAPDAPRYVPQAGLIERQATAMTVEYDAALRELQATGASVPAGNAALLQLDRSASQIRTAMAQDPNARFLLDRLRSTYERRLQLTRRLSIT